MTLNRMVLCICIPGKIQTLQQAQERLTISSLTQRNSVQLVIRNHSAIILVIAFVSNTLQMNNAVYHRTHAALRGQNAVCWGRLEPAGQSLRVHLHIRGIIRSRENIFD